MVFSFSQSMQRQSFSSSDGDWLFVPQTGTMSIKSEFGTLEASPTQVIVVPRLVKFTVGLVGSEPCRGYCVEVFNEGGFRLPELGPIGVNGLANPMHFEAPRAQFDTDSSLDWTHFYKVGDKWFNAQGRSPFNVVAWRGNMFPLKYDLNKFLAINSVSFDHPDPSIFTVLSVPSPMPGTAACDFVIFPHRWMVAEHTFRPPYFHRNVMSEFMVWICRLVALIWFPFRSANLTNPYALNAKKNCTGADQRALRWQKSRICSRWLFFAQSRDPPRSGRGNC